MKLSTADQSALAALANAIIPADDMDAGAASVNAGPRLVQKIETATNENVYADGLVTAAALAMERFQLPIESLDPQQSRELMGLLKDKAPAFFKQLRIDVCSMYLSDPQVWQRISFPGPSSQQGGHPDFDRRQEA